MNNECQIFMANSFEREVGYYWKTTVLSAQYRDREGKVKILKDV